MTTRTTSEPPAGGLIPIEIQVRGEIVSSNFLLFAERVRARLSEINRDLVTDDDFDQADKDAKAIGAAEKDLKDAKEAALAQADELYTLFGQIDGLSAELGKARLELDRKIKARKEDVRREIISEGIAAIGIDLELARKHFAGAIEAATKGKRSFTSMRKEVAVVVSTTVAKIAANRERIDRFESTHGATMTLDRRDLEVMSTDSVEGELRRRFDLKRAEDEKARLAEMAATAQAEAVKAKLDLQESAKPPAPPAGRQSASSPLPADLDGPSAATEAEEWTAFENALRSTFGALKASRANLKHSRNISRAQVLANGINQAWENR